MRPLSYALITPSYEPDFERCRLLVESVGRWVAPHVRHYLIIERRDLALFEPLGNARTRILVVQDLLPRWLIRLPRARRFWLSLRTRPVRNWVMQQIVKLSVAKAIGEDVLLYIDSDSFFVRPYDPRDLERDGCVPLYRETGQLGKIAFNDRWHSVAARLLGLPARTGYDTNFISQVMCWRRANVLRLHEHIERLGRRSWVAAVASQWVISEYILYGLFVTEVLGETSGHWYDGLDRTLCYWGTASLGRDELIAFKGKLVEYHHSVMISAKSHTPMAEIRDVFITPAERP